MSHPEEGYSLAELLVALAISLFLIGLVLTLVVDGRQTFFLIKRLYEVQNNAQIAFFWLSHDIRMAGLLGCVRWADTGSIDNEFTVDKRLVVWHEGKNHFMLMRSAAPRVDWRSDMLVVQARHPNTVLVKFAQAEKLVLVRPPDFHLGEKLLISDCQHAEIMYWPKINLKYTYQQGSEIGRIDKIIYYIGFTGRRHALTGLPIEALYRRNLNQSKNNPIELVEGVTSLSVRFGIQSTQTKRLIYLLPDQRKLGQEIHSVKITLWFSTDGLQRQWSQIIALRNPV